MITPAVQSLPVRARPGSPRRYATQNQPSQPQSTTHFGFRQVPTEEKESLGPRVFSLKLIIGLTLPASQGCFLVRRIKIRPYE
jgi:hypothetical protein